MSQATFVTPDHAHTIEIAGHGSPTTWPTSYYFGGRGDESPGPQAYHVSREPHRESRAHFHHVDQFQIFFGAADTTFQRHLTGPLLVHYSDSDTVYGPFASGDEPFSFMTLRAHGSKFKGFMPENKAEMTHDRNKRQYHRDLSKWLDEDFSHRDDAIAEQLIEPQDDQLCAIKVSLPIGAKFFAPSAAGSTGQYLVVVDGDVHLDGLSLPKFTIGWADPQDDAAVLVAGEAGARLVILQFGIENAARS